MTTVERMRALPFGQRLIIWCEMHDVGLIYALATYYTICGLVGFIEGFWIGNKIVGNW